MLLSLVLSSALAATTYRPVVLMHGLLTGSEAMSHAAKWISGDFPGIYIKNVEIGNGRDDSMFMNINDQVSSTLERLTDVLLCNVRIEQVANFAAQLANDSKLANGFNVIGHSQGGLITRAYIERFNNPPVYNWISWAGPQGGVFGVPDLNAYCPVEDCPWLNILFDQLLIDNTWLSQEVQENIAFASYWHDPLDQAAFASNNVFLADINNARDNKNATYKANMLSLNTALLVYSTNDHIVVPKESPWFSFFDYVNASDATVDLYSLLPDWTDDWIGMRTLASQKKLQMQSVPCGHQDIPRDVCKKYYTMYTMPLLNNTL